MGLKINPTPVTTTTLLDMATAGARRADIAKAVGVSLRTLHTWIMSDEFPEIKSAYVAAKQAYASDLAEGILEQARAPLHDDPKFANAEVARRRLIVETTRWVTSKLLPRVYGDNLKVNHEHSGTVTVSPLEQLRQLESIDIPKAPPMVIEVGEITEDDCF
tara:strand:- start:9901 stop:10383 length:483 start_codon:yes stop_codon:yes gene_type:complete